MTDIFPIDAVRAVGAPPNAALDAATSPSPVADPAAVARFQAVMDAPEVQHADPIPFAAEAAAAWRDAQANHQGILHRIRALASLDRGQSVSAAELVELQYEVMNHAFQQEVVSKVADKSSTAIQTLVKNQ